MPWSWPRTGRPGRRSATAPAAGRRRCRPRSCPRSRRRDRGGRGRSRERGTRPLRPPPRARRPRSAGRYRRPPGGGAALTGQRRSPARGYPPTTSPSLTGVIACRSTPSAASPSPFTLLSSRSSFDPTARPSARSDSTRDHAPTRNVFGSFRSCVNEHFVSRRSDRRPGAAVGGARCRTRRLGRRGPRRRPLDPQPQALPHVPGADLPVLTCGPSLVRLSPAVGPGSW